MYEKLSAKMVMQGGTRTQSHEIYNIYIYMGWRVEVRISPPPVQILYGNVHVRNEKHVSDALSYLKYSSCGM